MSRILVKYPTRQRPSLFLKTLKGYIDKSSNKENIHYLVSIDKDDESMSHEILDLAFKLGDNITIIRGQGSNKIEACNRDIEKIHDWDILILVSDDMECLADGWDNRIRQDFELNFPDLDGCLWYHDGAQSSICTLSIIGRKYYDRYGYIYHSSYKSFFCDNEFTEVAQKQGKIKLISRMIIRHQHPSWQGNTPYDTLYQRNDMFWQEDEKNYLLRKAKGFND